MLINYLGNAQLPHPIRLSQYIQIFDFRLCLYLCVSMLISCSIAPFIIWSLQFERLYQLTKVSLEFKRVWHTRTFCSSRNFEIVILHVEHQQHIANHCVNVDCRHFQKCRYVDILKIMILKHLLSAILSGKLDSSCRIVLFRLGGRAESHSNPNFPRSSLIFALSATLPRSVRQVSQ